MKNEPLAISFKHFKKQTNKKSILINSEYALTELSTQVTNMNTIARTLTFLHKS